MGQVVSTTTTNDESPKDNSQPASMESLIAEAVAYGDAGEESLEAKAKKALDCPCISHLKSGPCGNQFAEAFVCYLMSTAEEKGSDCVHPFVMLQSCIKSHPDAFSKDILDDEEVEKEVNPSTEPKIIPPRWSMESQDTKSKL